MAQDGSQKPFDTEEDKMWAAERQEEVIDLVGNLSEALIAPPTVFTNAATLFQYQLRYQLRRTLANLARFPEGHRFDWSIGDRHNSIILLTPPDQVAVRRIDGTWYRRVRMPQDGPAPYTLNWYRRYILQQGLPPWFLAPAHVAMLSNTTEADLLRLDTLAALPDPRAEHSPTGLMDAQQFLLPGLAGAGQTYSAVLDDALIRRLTVRFPAVLANATTFTDRRVYVLPSGHITIRWHGNHHPSSVPEVASTAFLWQAEVGSTYVSSYFIEGGQVPATTAPTTVDRAQLRRTIEEEGGFVDITQQVNGLGRVTWMDYNVDRPRARQLGYETPEEVLQARQDGLLDAIPHNGRPWTVWWPDTRFHNPTTQPDGDGHWDYLTTDARDEAHLNFGGQNHGGRGNFQNNPTPSASDIWLFRQELQNRGREDVTASIDLVWCPDGDVPDAPASAASSSDELDPRVFDPDTGLRHDPTNRGENNQTGDGKFHYQTIQINGKNYTVDRSRAHPNRIQPHKSWCVNRKGEWVQWKHYDTLDWTNKDQVEKMNKSREQVATRAKFPPKRKGRRPGYTADERTWLFDWVVKNKASRPSTADISDICRRFNEKFDRKREDGGIATVIDRLRIEYAKYKGQQKPKLPYQQTKKQQGKQNDEEDSEDDRDGGNESGDVNED